MTSFSENPGGSSVSFPRSQCCLVCPSPFDLGGRSLSKVTIFHINNELIQICRKNIKSSKMGKEKNN